MVRFSAWDAVRETATARWIVVDRAVRRPSGPSQLDLVKSSMSWRITEPLRTVKTLRAELGAVRRGDADDPDPAVARIAALRRRVIQAAPHLTAGLEPIPVAGRPTGRVLAALIDAVVADGGRDRFWLLLVAAAGTLPDADALAAARRQVSRAARRDRLRLLLDHAVDLMQRDHSHFRDLDVVTGRTVVDVDFCATHGFMSGIQRVVRETLSRWRDRDDLTLVGWDSIGSGLRRLLPEEVARVTDWNPGMRGEASYEARESPSSLVVPWRSTVLLPEVAQERYSDRLACLAESSGNRIVMIGYDTIPALRGFSVSRRESQIFAGYLGVVKHADEVLAISAAVGEEFGGFSDSLGAQGITGPVVTVLPLPDGTTAPRAADVEREVPLVLAVGSHEPRKNHIAVVDAAEVLWRRGHRFSLLLAGGSGPHGYRDLNDRVTALVLAGRPVSLVEGISDAELARAYSLARFQVFVSRYEGFGLPVVESLAAGTPVITSARGSMAEIAEAGGCVTVDPDDVEAIAAAMETLLVDDAELTRLERQILARPPHTWDDYARDVAARLSGAGA